MLPPLTFEPILKRIRWGGRHLGTRLNKQIGEGNDYAESWEIADHADGQSVVNSGPFVGEPLSVLMQKHRHELLGKQAPAKQFPLLIKFLDANDWLSLQVHPDDKNSKLYNANENGKTEAWVILDAQPDSQICAGLQHGVTPAHLRNALNEGHVEECLNLISVKPGDCIFVPAGTVHAIGPGLVLAEIQQQSNLTFRLFDWGRVDASGNPRPLHIEECISCTNFNRGPVVASKPVQLCDQTHPFEELLRCDYFVIRRHQFLDPIQIVTDDRFRILISLLGNATIESRYGSTRLKMGSTVLLPACSGDTAIIPDGAVCMLDVLCP